jgi:hypothetical protein
MPDGRGGLIPVKSLGIEGRKSKKVCQGKAIVGAKRG